MSFPKNARPSLSLRRWFFGIARLTVYAYPLSLPFDVTPAFRRTFSCLLSRGILGQARFLFLGRGRAIFFGF
jgi:hypothetical protein